MGSMAVQTCFASQIGIKPFRIPRLTASVRLLACNLLRMELMWNFAVCSEIARRPAISLLPRPGSPGEGPRIRGRSNLQSGHPRRDRSCRPMDYFETGREQKWDGEVRSRLQQPAVPFAYLPQFASREMTHEWTLEAQTAPRLDRGRRSEPPNRFQRELLKEIKHRGGPGRCVQICHQDVGFGRGKSRR